MSVRYLYIVIKNGGTCRHTLTIDHAKNFKIKEDIRVIMDDYWEVEREKLYARMSEN